MSALKQKKWTVEEYLAFDLDIANEGRHEFVNGSVYTTTGNSHHHSLILGGLIAAFHSQFRERDCRVLASLMRMYVPTRGSYLYPDILIVCGKSHLVPGVFDTITNPVLVIEVISPDKEARDRGVKFGEYRAHPMLQDILFVSSTEYLVEHYMRQGEQWLLTVFNGLEALVSISSVGVTLALADVYDKVTFDDKGNVNGAE